MALVMALVSERGRPPAGGLSIHLTAVAPPAAATHIWHMLAAAVHPQASECFSLSARWQTHLRLVCMSPQLLPLQSQLSSGTCSQQLHTLKIPVLLYAQALRHSATSGLSLTYWRCSHTLLVHAKTCNRCWSRPLPAGRAPILMGSPSTSPLCPAGTSKWPCCL